MEWIPYSDAYCQARVSSYCYVLSYQVLETDATRVLKQVILIYSGELPSMFVRRPGSLSWVTGMNKPDE
jgi:hypothetical protein